MMLTPKELPAPHIGDVPRETTPDSVATGVSFLIIELWMFHVEHPKLNSLPKKRVNNRLRNEPAHDHKKQLPDKRAAISHRQATTE